MISVENTISKNTHSKHSMVHQAGEELKHFSNQLYQQHGADFTNPEFSHQIANTLSKDLDHIPEEDIQSIHSNYFTSSNPNASPKYMYVAPQNNQQIIEEAENIGLMKNIKSKVNRKKKEIPLPNQQYMERRIRSRLQDLNKKWNRSNKQNTQQTKTPRADDLKTNIIQNMVVRGNLIGAIQSVLPKEEEQAPLQQRLHHCLNGEFCLPPVLDERKESYNTRRIMDYLHAKSQEEKTIHEKTQLPPSFHSFIQELANAYQQGTQSLQRIYVFLINPENTLSLDELNRIGIETRQVLDDLYIETELYYLVAVLALMHQDL
jgi:hypothetical protein